jgi:hypothetical protein
MIKIENVEVVGLQHAIRGMRNPMNSWDKSDSAYCVYSTSPDTAHCGGCPYFSHNCHGDDEDLYKNYIIGTNDHDLAKRLAAGGPVHAKYRRMIAVYLDITAPLYWWKEFDTYKVGTVANSCSTMHKIAEKEFTFEDFSCEHLLCYDDRELCNVPELHYYQVPADILKSTIRCLNFYREIFLETKDKKYWWQMIQLLPSSYNQKRTIMLNYEVLAGIYPMRKEHKLDEWRAFCKWIEELPYSEIIIGVNKNG